jgi:fructose-1-phosphate kinase PfkB-like protein
MPPGASPEKTGALLASLQQHCPVVADTQGEHLIQAARAGVFLLTPNSREAQEATGTATDLEAAAALLGLGAQGVFITQGRDGGLFVGPTSTEHLHSPALPGNPTGAGDALTAGVASRIASGTDTRDALCYGMAVAMASLSSPWAGDIAVSEIDTHLPSIQVTE